MLAAFVLISTISAFLALFNVVGLYLRLVKVEEANKSLAEKLQLEIGDVNYLYKQNIRINKRISALEGKSNDRDEDKTINRNSETNVNP